MLTLQTATYALLAVLSTQPGILPDPADAIQQTIAVVKRALANSIHPIILPENNEKLPPIICTKLAPTVASASPEATARRLFLEDTIEWYLALITGTIEGELSTLPILHAVADAVQSALLDAKLTDTRHFNPDRHHSAYNEPD